MNSMGFVWVTLGMALLPLLTMQPAQQPAPYDWSQARVSVNGVEAKVVIQHYDPKGYTTCMEGGSDMNACIQANLLPEQQHRKETP